MNNDILSNIKKISSNTLNTLSSILHKKSIIYPNELINKKSFFSSNKIIPVVNKIFEEKEEKVEEKNQEFFENYIKNQFEDSLSNIINSNQSSNDIQCENISPNLANLLNIYYNKKCCEKSSKESSWRIPSTNGLENSNEIIPSYYFTNHDYNKIFNIDYFNIIIDDIKNMRPLNKHQVKYITNIDKENLIIIINIFNNVIKMVKDCIDLEIEKQLRDVK